MPRQLRIDYPRAMHHAMSRRDRRENIFTRTTLTREISPGPWRRPARKPTGGPNIDKLGVIPVPKGVWEILAKNHSGGLRQPILRCLIFVVSVGLTAGCSSMEYTTNPHDPKYWNTDLDRYWQGHGYPDPVVFPPP